VVDRDAFLRYDGAVGRRVVVAGSHPPDRGHAVDPGETFTVRVMDEPQSVSRRT
jgi:hypothetical protein